MSQKLPVNYSEWIEHIFMYTMKDFKKTIIKKVIKDTCLKLMFNILKNNMNFTMIYHFYLKE